MADLRRFMFERVYLGPAAQREAEKIRFVIRTLFDRLCTHPQEIPETIPPGELSRRVTDYVAGMTDRFCMRAFEAISMPAAFAP
jgi:dGTPase